MSRRIAGAELRRLRNDVHITDLIRRLEIPWKRRDGYFRFLCPICSEFNTATNPRTNLGRCFRCRENFNPIDLVMRLEGLPFLEAVEFLRRVSRDCPLRDDPQKP